MTTIGYHAYRKNVIISILLACVGYAYYNIGDAGLKIITVKFHFSQIMFTSSSFILCMMAAYGWFKEGKKAFRTHKPGWMLVRALIAQVTAICNIFALPHIHLTTYYTLAFTSPLWVALLSAYFLKDKLDARRFCVILFGFLVVFFIFRPGGEMFNVWALLTLFNAFVYSCQLIIMRHIGPGESRSFMIMCGSTVTLLLTGPLLGQHFVIPTPYEWGLFLMLGTTGSIGLLCVSYAFQAAPSAAVVAPYHYTQIIWGALLGYYLFNEVPSVEIVVGAALIILAGLYLLHSETRKSALKTLEIKA